MNANYLSNFVTLNTLRVLRILKDLKAFKSNPLEIPKTKKTKTEINNRENDNNPIKHVHTIPHVANRRQSHQLQSELRNENRSKNIIQPIKLLPITLQWCHFHPCSPATSSKSCSSAPKLKVRFTVNMMKLSNKEVWITRLTTLRIP